MATADPITTQIVPLRMLQGEEITEEKKARAVDLKIASDRLSSNFNSEEEYLKALQGLVFSEASALKSINYYEFNSKETFK